MRWSSRFAWPVHEALEAGEAPAAQGIPLEVADARALVCWIGKTIRLGAEKLGAESGAPVNADDRSPTFRRFIGDNDVLKDDVRGMTMPSASSNLYWSGFPAPGDMSATRVGHRSSRMSASGAGLPSGLWFWSRVKREPGYAGWLMTRSWGDERMSANTQPHRRRRIREVAAQFGGTEIVDTDAPVYDLRDPYHALLAMGWGPFLFGVLGYFLALNALFATLYALQPGSVVNLPPGHWDDAFFFSVETFGSVGYGVMAPQTRYGHVIATIEVFIGLLSTAVLTGLIFVRFARPRANMEFSRHMTIAPHDGVPTLSLRLANRRTGTIYDAEARLTLVRRYQTVEGHWMWRSQDLPLIRSRVQALSLAWTLRHTIDDTSPLNGLSAEQLIETDSQFVISITGTDATLAAPVHAVHAYEPPDLLWGFRFADVMTVDGRGRTRIELARLHEVMPARPPAEAALTVATRSTGSSSGGT
jgi:inward rectifier potassium channel